MTTNTLTNRALALTIAVITVLISSGVIFLADSDTSNAIVPSSRRTVTPSSGSRSRVVVPITPDIRNIRSTTSQSQDSGLEIQQRSISDVSFNADQTLTVLRARVSASDDSDVSVTRVRVSLQALGGENKDNNPVRTFEKLELFVDNEMVSRKTLTSSSSIDRDEDIYTILVSGLNLFSVPAGESVDIRIKLTTEQTLATSRHQSWKVWLPNNAIRGTNERFQYVYAEEDGNDRIEEQFVVVTESTSRVVSADQEGTLAVEVNSDIDWVDAGPNEERTVMSLNLTAEDSDIELSRMTVFLKRPSTATTNDAIDRLKLYVNDELVRTHTVWQSTQEPTFTFIFPSNVNQNESKTVVIKRGRTIRMDIAVVVDEDAATDDNLLGTWTVGFKDWSSSQGIRYKDGTDELKDVRITKVNRFNVVDVSTGGRYRGGRNFTIQRVNIPKPTISENRTANVLEMTFSEGNSDIELDTITLELESRGGDNRNKLPWESFDNIQIITRRGTGVGPTIASKTNLRSSDFERDGDKYTISFERIGKDLGRQSTSSSREDLTFFVRIWGESTLDADQSQDWTIRIPENGVRGIDENENYQYVGGISDIFTVRRESTRRISSPNDNIGDLYVAVSSSPRNVEIEEGDEETVMAVDLEADESDITLKTLRINFEAQGTDEQESEPWETFNRIRVELDNQLIKREILTRSDFTGPNGDGSYMITLEDLTDTSDRTTIEEDETGELEISLQTRTDLNDDDHSQEWELRFDSLLGITAEDETDRSVLGEGSAVRSFTVDASGRRTTDDDDDDNDNQGEDGEVRIRLNSNTPDRRNVRASASRTTDGVELLSFELDNTGDEDVTIDDIEVRLTSNVRVGDVVETAKLYNSRGTLLDSVSVTSSSTSQLVVFRNLDIDLDENESVDFTVEVDVEQITQNNTTLYARALDASFDEDDVDVSGSATGNTVTFTVTVTGPPTIQLHSGRLSYPQTLSDGATDRTLITATFVVDVTARGEDIYLPKNCDSRNNRDDNTGFVIEVPQLVGSGRNYGEIVCAGIADSNDRFRIRAGDAARITLKANIQSVGTQSGQGAGHIWTSITPAVTQMQYSTSRTGSLRTQSITGVTTDTLWLLSKNWNN